MGGFAITQNATGHNMHRYGQTCVMCLLPWRKKINNLLFLSDSAETP